MQEQKFASLETIAVAALSGILFGLGLGISEMLNPARVLGFLDISGTWDPTLLFVMGGALLITFPAFRFVRHMRKPVYGSAFALPTRKDIDARLIQGAALFGIGWGLAGLCPGPAIAGLASLNPQILLFFVAMLAGMFGFRLFAEKSR
jgi:hypothetical protein